MVMKKIVLGALIIWPLIFHGKIVAIEKNQTTDINKLRIPASVTPQNKNRLNEERKLEELGLDELQHFLKKAKYDFEGSERSQQPKIQQMEMESSEISNNKNTNLDTIRGKIVNKVKSMLKEKYDDIEDLKNNEVTKLKQNLSEDSKRSYRVDEAEREYHSQVENNDVDIRESKALHPNLEDAENFHANKNRKFNKFSRGNRFLSEEHENQSSLKANVEHVSDEENQNGRLLDDKIDSYFEEPEQFDERRNQQIEMKNNENHENNENKGNENVDRKGGRFMEKVKVVLTKKAPNLEKENELLDNYFKKYQILFPPQYNLPGKTKTKSGSKDEGRVPKLAPKRSSEIKNKQKVAGFEFYQPEQRTRFLSGEVEGSGRNVDERMENLDKNELNTNYRNLKMRETVVKTVENFKKHLNDRTHDLETVLRGKGRRDNGGFLLNLGRKNNEIYANNYH